MLKKIYEAAVLAGKIRADDNQRHVLDSIEILEQALVNRPRFTPFWKKNAPIKGLYIYGPVGAGKTFLMDLFFDNLSTPLKLRFHFHHFIQTIDLRLRQLQGKKNPLNEIAAEIAKKAKVLCFDEFLVNDVADAMILAELFKELLEKEVILIATSNTAPDNLYLNGVHRERFLPVIDMIKSHCEVLYLASLEDYRLGRELSLKTYLYPLSEDNQQLFTHQFAHLEPDARSNGELIIQTRKIPFLFCGQSSVGFDFKIICNLPRSQLDYLEISDHFDTVFLANMPILGENDTLFVILLIHLVDVFYDRGVQLIILADCALENLYVKGEMLTEFRRTYSRLKEMQAKDFVERHLRRKSNANFSSASKLAE